MDSGAWELISGKEPRARGIEQPEKASVNQARGEEPSPRTSADASSLSINSCHHGEGR